jgi:hypothetical protein
MHYFSDKIKSTNNQFFTIQLNANIKILVQPLHKLSRAIKIGLKIIHIPAQCSPNTNSEGKGKFSTRAAPDLCDVPRKVQLKNLILPLSF